MKVARFVSAMVSCGVLAVLSSGCDVDAGTPVEGVFDRTLAVNGPGRVGWAPQVTNKPVAGAIALGPSRTGELASWQAAMIHKSPR